jgi:phage replication-related protein YjqB (UPF0714/DUF867 family)
MSHVWVPCPHSGETSAAPDDRVFNPVASQKLHFGQTQFDEAAACDKLGHQTVYAVVSISTYSHTLELQKLVG